MRSKMLLALVLAGGLGTGAAQANPAQANPAPGKENPAPSSRDYSKEAYVIEKLHTQVTEESDGSGTRDFTAEIRILADAGVKAFAVLNFAYTSADETVDVDYVRVRKADGTVVKTPDYNIQDMPADVTRTAPMYSDIHEKHIAVKSLGVGDVLEYLVHYRVVKPQVPGHFWYEDSFVKNAIVKDQRLEISVPNNKYAKVFSPDFKPEIKDEAGRRIYTWTHSNLALEEKDPNEAPLRVPPNPTVQMTTFAAWEDIGRWYGSLQKDALEVTPAIQAKAAELTKGLKSDEEKIRAIYSFVALRFHYIGLDFGIGRYRPHAADDVLGNGYGDCKDKHTLLASLLKASGYEAWPVLIHAQRKLDSEVPSPAQFNHVITVVPSGDQLIWLDTTPEVAPYGLLMNALRDKEALVIPTNKPPFLMKTPANPPFLQRQEFSVKGGLSGNGTFTGHVEQLYRGDVEVLLRTLFRQVAQAQWKQAAQGFSYRLNFGGDVSNVTITPPDALDKPFQLSYDYVRKNYGDWENRQISAPMPPMGIEVTKDSKEKKPPEPVPLGALGKIVYHSRVELPHGYSMIAPKPVNLVEPYAEYHTTNLFEQGALTTTRVLEIKKNEIALNEWEDFRRFGKAIADDEFNFIHLDGKGTVADVGLESDEEIGDDNDVDEKFRQGTQALQWRDFLRAQRLFEKVIAREPTYEGAHLNLGFALGAQNKFSEALVEFRKQEEMTPDDPRAYTVAASVASMIGRKDVAMEEWRKLLKVNPENRDAALNVSQMLSQAGKYSEAANVLEGAVKASPETASLQYALGSAYLKTGQSEKAVAHLRAAVEAKSDDAMLLNNVAYDLAENKTNLDLSRQYAEEALRELETRSAKDIVAIDAGTRLTYQFSLVWDTLGWVYFQSGDTDRSERFVRAAWLLSQDAIEGEHLGEIYEKEGKNKEAAHAYELALAAVGTPLFSTSGAPSGLAIASPVGSSERQDLATRLASRYQKLTGKRPSINETWRLPNGEWTKTASEQLSQMRTAKFGKLPNLSGSAEFAIVFAPGKIESVEYVSGETSLKALTEKIKAAHYQLEFPAGSQARILRRVDLHCSPLSGCIAVLVPTDQAMAGAAGRPGPAGGVETTGR